MNEDTLAQLFEDCKTMKDDLVLAWSDGDLDGAFMGVVVGLTALMAQVGVIMEFFRSERLEIPMVNVFDPEAS